MFDYIVGFIIGLIAVSIFIRVLTARSHTDNRRLTRPSNRDWVFTPEYKRAGIRGEEAAVRAIRPILRGDDHLLTNVRIAYDGKPTELDAVIVNRYGIFIIEIKNYVGLIVGRENDYEWQKFKTTKAGNTYEKKVMNPIKQVKRQIFILAHYLEYYGLRVWVKGYAILLEDNSPVESDYLLHSVADIECAIHTRDRTLLSADTVDAIIKLIS